MGGETTWGESRDSDMHRCTLSKLSRSLDENIPENFKGDQWGRALSANGSPDR